jgi:hypothetical protein
LLLPHAADFRALRLLIHFAGQREDWQRVLELSRALLADEPTGQDRLTHIEALYRSGRKEDAQRQLATLRVDTSVGGDVRRRAFRLSSDAADEARDFSLVEQITRDWLRFDEESVDAAWRRVHALMRLSRFAEALDVVRQMELEPTTVSEAELMAAAYERAADPAEAARQLARLSDRFGRPEPLEALFLVTAIRVDIDSRAPELGERIRSGFEEFPKRFPESKAIQLVEFDPTEEGMDAFFREHIEPGAQHIRELHDQMLDGEIPVAALAAAAHKPLTFVWGRLAPSVPLDFGDPTLDALERDDAGEAIGRPVVLDPTSLSVISSLGKDLERTILSSYPASIVAQATLDDVGRATSMATTERDEYLEIGYDAARDERWRREWTADEVRQERESLQRVLALARDVLVVPDVSLENPTELDEFLQGEDREPAFIVWPASFAVAQRDGKPIYSDDRALRVFARRGGIPAFGTLAALDALTARGLIAEEARVAARRDLRERGGLGVWATSEEVIGEARDAGWDITVSVAQALLDPTNWRRPPADAFRTWVDFLRAVFTDAPEHFDAWIARIIDAVVRASKEGVGPLEARAFAERSIGLMAWITSASVVRGLFFRRVLEGLRASRNVFGWAPDPLFGIAIDLQRLSEESEDEATRGLFFRMFLTDLQFKDQLLLLGVTV